MAQLRKGDSFCGRRRPAAAQAAVGAASADRTIAQTYPAGNTYHSQRDQRIICFDEADGKIDEDQR